MVKINELTGIIVANAYAKHVLYIKLGMVFMVLGVINFIISYMYIPEIWVKTLSASTILILLGLSIIFIYEDKVQKLRRHFN